MNTLILILVALAFASGIFGAVVAVRVLASDEG